MKRIMSLITVLVTLLFMACDKTPQGGDAEIDVQLEIPGTITLNEGDSEVSFRIKFSKAPLESDKIAFEDAKGDRYNCPLVLSGNSVKVTLVPEIVTGSYKIYVVRGAAAKLMGETSVLFQKEGMQLDPKTTVYGTVTCDGNPLKGVVVSDGVEVVTTDENGMYQLKSAKYHRYVFISVPSGYEVKSDGVFPMIHKQLKSAASTLESVNFELVKADRQDNHIMLVMGDMHLANRNNDLAQFGRFTDEVNSFITANSGKKIYGVTLGDMTWDCYWTRLDLPTYKTQINHINGIQIFQTMGNHDYDQDFAGDYDTAIEYKQLIAPTYYSFNIGKVHYIVLDDIKCTNKGTGSEGREYTANFVDELITWLKQDLQYVSKDTPLVLTMHAPLRDVNNKGKVIDLISPYETVHVLSGHTHKVTNYIESEYMEHVSGAVCADWWWAGKNNETLLSSTDGAPGGYAIWDVAGKEFKWRYKATGRPDDYQFRSYDLNNVVFTKENLTTDINEDNLNDYIKAYPASSANEVLVNVWNWNDKWKITITDEKGNTLEPKHESAYDPMHIASRYSWVSKTTSNFPTQKNGDFFRVRASDADVDLTITVEDEFGNIYKETMVRPKAFDKETYK